MQFTMKKMTAFLAALVLFVQTGIFPALAKPDWPADTGILAEAGILMDAESGTVLYGQQIHVEFPPASITKLLTALIVAENAEMDEIVEFSRDAVYNVESDSGNKLSLDVGDKLSVEDCLYVLLLQSSNQTANALAEHVAGSREAFVEMMNQKLADLGLSESHFANPSGLNDESQLVSSYDMAQIARAAFENPKVLEISSARSHSIPPTKNNPEGAKFRMEHRLLRTDDENDEFYCEGAMAGKTGFTSKAGNTLVTLAECDGRRQIAVILRGTQPQYYLDSKNLLDFGFASFQNMNIAEHETYLTENETLEAGGTSYATADLSLDETAELTLPKECTFADAERSIVTELPEKAPENAVAMIQYTYNDRKIGSSYIMRQEAVIPVEETEASETGGMVEMTVEETETAAVPQPEKKAPSVDLGGILPMILMIILLIIAAVVIILVKKKKDEERDRVRERIRARRQKVLESGVSEEEYEAVLAARKKKENEDADWYQREEEESADDDLLEDVSLEEEDDRDEKHDES